MKNLIARIKYFLKHGKDDYGHKGFNQLMYKGIPILIDPNLDILYFVNDDFSFRYPKKKDGTKDMRFSINNSKWRNL